MEELEELELELELELEPEDEAAGRIVLAEYAAAVCNCSNLEASMVIRRPLSGGGVSRRASSGCVGSAGVSGPRRGVPIGVSSEKWKFECGTGKEK